jgi:hypothetical protein
VLVVVGVGNVTFSVAGVIIVVVDVALFLLCLMFLVLHKVFGVVIDLFVFNLVVVIIVGNLTLLLVVLLLLLLLLQRRIDIWLTCPPSAHTPPTKAKKNLTHETKSNKKLARHSTWICFVKNNYSSYLYMNTFYWFTLFLF